MRKNPTRTWFKTTIRRAAIAALAFITTVGAVGIVSASAASDPQPPFIPPTADWLTTVNYYRAMAGLPPVTEDPAFSAGAYNHSCYMLFNGITHNETPGKLGYTTEGNLAGSNGNVAVSSVYGTSARTHVELWMTGPFHAIGVLRSNLRTVGFGKCDSQSTSPWRSGGTLDIIRGIVPGPQRSTPVLFPGDGATTNLDRFMTESPNPLTYCGWTGSAGLPVLALMPEAAINSTATMSGPNGPVQVCVLSAANTSGVAQSILSGENAVVVIPRDPMAPGLYSVNVNTSARSVAWSFTVDPTAATGVTPIPQADPIGPTLRLQSITPVRVVDTRFQLGTTALNGGWERRIQIAGRLGIPADATSVVANFTVVNPLGYGYLTLWNCGAPRPTVSSLNYGPNDIVPNTAVIPLAADGSICVYSLSNTDLVVDVSGYLSAGGADGYTPVTPTRLIDTRIGQGPATRFQAGQTIELQVAGRAGVAADATTAALNVVATGAGSQGYVTVYPCDEPQPLAANLNPVPGQTRGNMVVAPLSANGSVCIFSLNETDLVVDISGYWSGSSTTRFTATTPFRFTDTRDLWRPAINAGTGGSSVYGGQTITIQMAGVRGIPADAKAVSVNLAVVSGVSEGYLTAWGCGAMPFVSNLNYLAGSAVANAAVVPLSADGRLCLRLFASAHVVIDVNGWWS